MKEALWIMLNPSTADSFTNDATVENIVQRTALWSGDIRPGDRPPDCRMSAELSACGRYRLELRRWWNAGAVDWIEEPPLAGVHGLIVGNLYAYRATDPDELLELTAEEAIGADNDDALQAQIRQAHVVICAWGNGPWRLRSEVHANRVRAVVSMIHAAGKTAWMLDRTKAGMPRHPLYFPMGEPLREYSMPRLPGYAA